MLKKLAACLCTVLLCAGIVGCASQEPVAATVMGQSILESEVTDYIETFRSGMQYSSEQAWAGYLAAKGTDPEGMRKTTIYELAAPIVVRSKADELGVTVDESEVDAQVNAMRSSLLAADDETWNDELERYGTSEEKLRETYATKNLEQQVFAKVVGDAEATEADIRNYVGENLAGQTAKKIECVYGSGYTYMQAALDKAQKAGFGASGMKKIAAKADDKTTHYVQLGWDVNCELTQNMKNAIAKLSKGEMADSLLSENGVYYLFYVSDAYKFPLEPDKVDLSDASLKEALGELAAATLVEAQGSLWLQQQIEENTTVNDMPAGLSYDVDMDALSSSSAASSQSAEAAGA